MHITLGRPRQSDRTIDRVIVGVIAALVVGTLTIGALYLVDRYVASPPTLVDQKTAELEAALRRSPNDLTIRLQLAGAYTASQRFGEAATQFGEVLTAAATIDDGAGFIKTARLGRGDALRLAGDLTAAATDYQAVVAMARDGEFAGVDVELQAAYFQLGSIALTQDRSGDAIAALSDALKIDQTDADSLSLLGQAYLADGDATKAVTSLRRAVLFVPIGWCDPYVTLGRSYTALGQVEEAAWADAMADLCLKTGEDVRPRLTALTGGPAALDATVGLGIIAELDGDRAAAAAWYGQAVALDPEDYTAASGLSRVSDDPHGSTPPAPITPSPGTPRGDG